MKAGDQALLLISVAGFGPGRVVDLIEFIEANTELEALGGTWVRNKYDSWVFSANDLPAEFAFAPKQYLMPLRGDPSQLGISESEKVGEPA